MSFGMGNTFVPITLIATTNVEPDDAGLASGLFNTSQQIGGALGLAILSTVSASATANTLSGVSKPTAAQVSQALVDGFHVAFLGSAIFVVAGALLLILLLGRSDVVAVGEGQPAAETA